VKKKSAQSSFSPSKESENFLTYPTASTGFPWLAAMKHIMMMAKGKTTLMNFISGINLE
jgi:hypothetical protein